jgi:hypothetical protein
MTETATETAVPATQEDTTPLPPLKTLHNAFINEIKEQVSAANEAAGTIATADGNDAALTEAIVAEADPSSDLGKTLTKINKLMDALSDLNAAKDAAVAEALKERKAATGTVDVEALKVIFDKNRQEATANLKMLKTLLSKEFDASTVDRILQTVPAIVGARKSSGGTGTGGTRVRGYSFYVDGAPDRITMEVATTVDGVKTKVERSNLAAVANFLSSDEIDVEQETLKEAFYAAAGTKVAADLPDVVEFTALDGENKSRNIKAVKDKASTDNGAAVTVTAEG